jgi:hypothetical protein
MSLPDAAPRPWYRPGLADVVFLLAALAVLRGAGQGLLDDPGLGWHLRNIDAMIDKGGWLREDPFTDPRVHPRAEWYTNQWLGEAPLWLGWRLAGLEGIAVATALVIGLMARCLYGILVRDGLPWPAACFWTALGVVGTSCSWNARPNVFTILFVLITARVCERFSAGCTHPPTPTPAEGEEARSADGAIRRDLPAHPSPADRTGPLTLPPFGGEGGPRLWWLVPLFALWANIHGGFVAGLIILFAAAGCEFLRTMGSLTAEERSGATSRFLSLSLLAGACLLATLVNPYGPGVYRWVFGLIGDKYYMDLHQEWKSPDFHGAGAMRFEILILLFPLVLGLSARKPGLLELALAVLWLHLALTGFRYVALWAAVAVPLLARSSMEIPYLRELARRWRLSAGPGSPFATRREAGPWAWSAAFAAALVGGAVLLQGRGAGHGENIIAVKALDRFLTLHERWRAEHGHRPVVFHSYDWGGYLTWHGWPKVLNWIDDRNEVQRKKHIQDYFAIRDAEPGWEKKLGEVDLVCIEPGAALAHRLEERRGLWREVYRDDRAVIFERRAGG